MPVKPGTQIPLSPEHIDETNYLLLTGKHGAQGVSAPPAQTIRFGRAIVREFQGPTTFTFTDADTKIPKDYVSVGFWLAGTFVTDPNGWRVYVGPDSYDWAWPGGMAADSLKRLTGSVPISVLGVGATVITFHTIITCERTLEAFQNWQLQTYTAIMQAYEKRRSDYEDKLAALQVQGVQIGGQNPAINQQIIRDELRRECLNMWTADTWWIPDGIFTGPAPLKYPEINPWAAWEIGRRAGLLEQAFDWDNLTFEFYPFFWGRKGHWLDVLALEDPDPLFEQFLRAGAARVLVPVKRKFEQAVLFYQLTGSIWSVGPVPPLTPATDPEVALYNGYLEELASAAVDEDIEKDVVIDKADPETWLIKVPTTLVWLQSDSELPVFES
jgi:hypothetical protein